MLLKTTGDVEARRLAASLAILTEHLGKYSGGADRPFAIYLEQAGSVDDAADTWHPTGTNTPSESGTLVLAGHQSCSAPRAVKALRGFAALTDKRLLSLRGYNTIVAEATAQDSDWVTQSSIASAEVMANLQSPTATGIFPSLVNVVRGGD